MEKKTIKIDADTSGAVKGLKRAEQGTKSLSAGTKAAAASTGLLAKGFKLVGMAMKAAGIGLIISAFLALKNIMTNNIEFARKLEVIWQQLTAVASVIVDRVTDLINGTRSLTSVFKGMGAEARREAQAMKVLTIAIQGVRDAEREMIVVRAQANQVIAASRLLAEDETKSKEERQAALLNAIKVETEVSEQEIELAQRRMENKRDEIDLGKSGEDAFEELAQLRADVINLETASMLKKKRVITEVNTFAREIAAEEKARLKSTSGSVSKSVKKQVSSYKELMDILGKLNEDEKEIWVLETEIAEITTKHNTELEKLNKTIEKKQKNEKSGVGTLSEHLDKHNLYVQSLIDEKTQIEANEDAIRKKFNQEGKSLEKINSDWAFYNMMAKQEEERLAREGDVGKEAAKIREQLNAYKLKRRNAFEAQRRLIDTKAEKDRLDIKIKANQDETKVLEDGITSKLSKNKSYNKRLIKDQKKAGEEIDELEKTFANAILEKKEKSVAKMRLIIGEEEDREIDALRKKYEELNGMIKGEAVAEQELEIWHQEQLLSITEKYTKKRMSWIDILKKKAKDTAQEKFDAETDAMNRGFSIASSITSSLGQLADGNTKKQKKLALLGVAIDTAAGIAGGVRAAINAGKDTGAAAPFVIPLLIAEMIALVIGGVAQAHSILNKVPGGGGGQPQLQGVTGGINVGGGEGGVPNLPGEGEDMDIPPIQAFVVESDVTSSQALQNDLELQATL